MGTKHTPGPWERGSALGVVAGAGVDLRIVFQPYTDGANGPVLGLSEKVANANLAASAPELLEALELFVEDFTERNEPSTWMPGERAAVEQSRKAIAKAKGETK